MRQVGTKTVVIDGQERQVRVFESRESAAERKGRKAATDVRMSFEQRREAMAESAYVSGVHPLSRSFDDEAR